MIHDGRSRKLPFDPAEAIAHLRASDAKLGALIDRAGAFTLRLDPSPSPFESLLESILYQQLHGKAAATIHRRVREYFGGDPAPQLLLDTPDEPLRAAGVSGNKIKALRDLAARTLDGTVPTHAAIRKMTDAEIVERLTAVRGIGPWTVEMLLIFRMGRPDVLPVTDYGVRKGFALTFQRLPKTRPLEAADLPKPEVLLEAGKALGAVPLRGQLVSVAGVRSGERCAAIWAFEPTIAKTAGPPLRYADKRQGYAYANCKALCLHSWSLLPAAPREPLAGDGRDAGHGRALSRLERAHLRRVLRHQRRGAHRQQRRTRSRAS